VRRARTVVLGALLVYLAIEPAGPRAAGQAGSAGRVPAQQKVVEGLAFRLSEGDPQVVAVTRPPVAGATPLDDRDVQKVFDRLPPLKVPAQERQPLALRESSLPPPRAGKTIATPFPPEAVLEPPRVEAAGPLRILRRAPDGVVPLAPNLSVTFSEPMVAVTSHEETTRENVPVRLNPTPPGRWRWVGTRTLLFEPDGRFPMATDYTVEVPAGTKSATGDTLDKAERWTFSTPPPTMVTSAPVKGPAVRDPLFFAAFDQKIDPRLVLDTIAVGAGTTSPTVHLATDEEVKRDRDVSQLVKNAGQGRWVAFKAGPALPADTEVTVTVGRGTPSAEGPKKTAQAQAWRFRTFGLLHVTNHECGYRAECGPGMPWLISFSNPIDARRFNKEMVNVAPELPGLKVAVYGASMSISGRGRARTTYTVTLAEAVTDVFGQTLGRSEKVGFTVGPARPSLLSPGGPFVVVDAAAGATLPVFTTNHESLNIRLYGVDPEDWPAFQKYLQTSRRNEPQQPVPGRPVLATTVAVKGRQDELAETPIDLAPALRNGYGQVVVLVEPTNPSRDRRGPPERVQAWVQVTGIGLDAFVDDQNLEAWTTSLTNGRPLSRVAVSLAPGGATATTDATGLATLPLTTTQASSVLVARLGPDVAILPQSPGGGSGPGWRRAPRTDELRWNVFDDRRIYRPGEEVHVKGWLRLIGAGPAGDVMPLGSSARTITYALRDSRNNEITKGSTSLNTWGGFSLALSLPATMNLGPATLRLEADAAGLAGRSNAYAFQVEEFRRPEYEVTTVASGGPHIVGGHATLTVTASYYAGGGLQGADVTWRVVSSPGRFVPPNRGEYSFGLATDRWERDLEVRAQPRVETFKSVTDGTGQHRLRIDFDSVDPPQAMNVAAEATLFDVNRQVWTSRQALLVHPSELYVGLKTPRSFVQMGDPIPVDVIVTDLDGTARPGRKAALRAERLDWEQVGGEWQPRYVGRQNCSVTSGPDARRCEFKAAEGGLYRITATVDDDRARRNQTQIRVWVAGGTRVPARRLEQELVTLVSDKKDYRVGDLAEVLVVAPFTPAEGVLTLRRSGLVRTERFTMRGPSQTLKVRIEDGWIPNVHVQVDLVGSAARTDQAGVTGPGRPPRPAFASGSLDLPVPPIDRTLAVQVAPRVKALEPGGETTVDVALSDSAGTPVRGAEVAVVVVDEAVLSLTRYKMSDPVAVFYSPRRDGVVDHHLRRYVVLAPRSDAATVTEAVTVTAESPLIQRAVAGGVVGGVVGGLPETGVQTLAFDKAESKEAQPIRLRTDLNPLALFAASVPTDADGRAAVAVRVPDNLTRYRIMAVAATEGAKFGSGESTLTARLPLMVRASPPRFLNFGDRVELPVVVQNQTDLAMDVDVVARASNAELTAGRGRRVAVPADDRVEVRFPVSAEDAGTARFQVGAVSGRWADASEFSLPVWTPATTEAFATYGQLDNGAIAQPVRAPSDAFPQFGGLEVATSSTALQALTDAVLYLVSYPFECAEQLSSRVLAVAALKDVLTAFKAEGLPSADEMSAAVKRDVERLAALQNDDGGFAFWRRGDESWPYISIHAAHALLRAKAKGFEVPARTLEASKAYLRDIEKRMPESYGENARRTLVAYALYVRKLMGETDLARARALIREAGLQRLSFEAVGWLLSVLTGDRASTAEVAGIRIHLTNNVTETASTAHFVVSYGDDGYLLLHSDRRADAIALEALIADQPGSDLIPKLVEGLLGQRKAGHWTNTQENVFVLLALERYFDTYEKRTPDFVARIWLGDRYAGERTFKERTTDRAAVEIPMTVVAGVKGGTTLTLTKEGMGRLYYRIGMRYAPASLALDRADHGFTVERAYEAVDDRGDVSRGPDGRWRIKAGARVRIKLTMVAQARRYHVALVDPLPAGLEPLNEALATTETIPPLLPPEIPGTGGPRQGGPAAGLMWWRWSRPWFEHQNMRDDRVEAFASLLWDGVYTYSYVARATTPGTFVVPPPRAEEMYHPETFGRGETDRVVVQ
jgi:uncharacterized protein YfaS (alpha-2-macroglobulin family)